jgi:hypothetical protein
VLTNGCDMMLCLVLCRGWPLALPVSCRVKLQAGARSCRHSETLPVKNWVHSDGVLSPYCRWPLALPVACRVAGRAGA